MANPQPRRRSVPPYVIAVLGLKKSGKTAVAQGLIASLRARGYAVAALKTSHLQRLDLDREGSDSGRLAAAGADYLLVHAAAEVLILERREQQPPLARLLAGVPPHIQFVVCEGGEADRADALLLCLAQARDLPEALATRGLAPGKILALSGLIASGPAPLPGEQRDLPVFDIRDPKGREALTELILQRAGSPPPSGRPGGPLARDPGWLPG